MSECRQDPCAGGRRWIEVTSATVSCRSCSYGAQSPLQTLVLHRGRRERQIKIGRAQRKLRDWKMAELNSGRREGDKILQDSKSF